MAVGVAGTVARPAIRVAELRETAAVHAAVEALRAAVDQVDDESGRDAAAAAWHEEPVVRFFCSTYGGAVTGVRVNEDSFIVVTATVPGNDVIDVTIAVGPDGTCACKVSTADGDRASAAPDVRAFEQVPAGRLAEVGGARPARRRPQLTAVRLAGDGVRRESAISPFLPGTLQRLRH